MQILKIYKIFEVLPGVYDAKEVYKQYFVDEDADKAQKLADELNATYKRLGCADTYQAEVHKCED